MGRELLLPAQSTRLASKLPLPNNKATTIFIHIAQLLKKKITSKVGKKIA
jgi:hypothetical protein